LASPVGEVDFWISWIFNFLQLAIYGKNNSNFMSSYAEMSFLKPKITTQGPTFFGGNRSLWCLKNLSFCADFKMGLFIFVSISYKKLEPSNSIF
jgi:hypothetical protein